MAILKTIVADGDDWSLFGAKIPDGCFLCGKQLRFPLVYWNGCNGEPGREDSLQIWLHPDCAHKLGENLIRDGQTAHIGIMTR